MKNLPRPAANVRVLELLSGSSVPNRDTESSYAHFPAIEASPTPSRLQFQRDKDALLTPRAAGQAGELPSIDQDSLLPDIEVGAADRDATRLRRARGTAGTFWPLPLRAKAAASSGGRCHTRRDRLSGGAGSLTAFARRIRERASSASNYQGSGVDAACGGAQALMRRWPVEVGRIGARSATFPLFQCAQVWSSWGNRRASVARSGPACLVAGLSARCGCARAARRVRYSSGTAVAEAVDGFILRVMALEDGELGVDCRLLRWLPTLSWCRGASRRYGRLGRWRCTKRVPFRASVLNGCVDCRSIGVHVDDIGAHFGRTRRQVYDIEYLASVGDSAR